MLVVVSMFGNVGVTWLLLPFWAAMFMGFVAGVSMVLSIANIYFRDLAHLVSVFLQLLFYATPVLYQASAISNPTMRKILQSNPMSQFIDIFRDLVYGLTPGDWKSWCYVVAWTAVVIALGALVYTRNGRDLGEQL